jgi:hypothetical protein
LIDGWRQFASAPISEIAFEQWRQYLAGIEEGRRAVPRQQWVELFLEDLLDHPELTVPWLFDRLGVEPSEAVDRKFRELLAHPINSISPAGRDKWRGENRVAMHQLLPRIAELAPVLGCKVDPVTGAFSYAEPAGVADVD